MRFGFGRRLRHPFYPALKLAPAAKARHEAPALCGGCEELFLAAAAGVRVRRAVFPLRLPAEPFLSPLERDTLWDRFKVPIYALLLDGHGRLIGYECEAQQGIHLVEDYAPGLLFGRIESAACECGRPGVRLMPPVGQAEEIHQQTLLAG